MPHSYIPYYPQFSSWPLEGGRRVRRMAAGVRQRLTRVCLVCRMARSATPPYHFLTSLPSMVLMPILISTNLDSRCLICHDSIATIDISLPPFDPPSSNCPISIPTLSIGGDMATLPLTCGHHGVTWWPAMPWTPRLLAQLNAPQMSQVSCRVSASCLLFCHSCLKFDLRRPRR